MQHALYPLRLRPVYKDYLWGGHRIAEAFGRTDTPAVCAESWEIADRPEGMSRIVNGPLAGTDLHELLQQMGPALVGEGDIPANFPLLVKIIDARERLSVQVHPDDRGAAEHGGDPKTEAWYILDGTPGCGVFLGLRPDVAVESLRRALSGHSVERLLRTFPARPGTAIFVPGGVPHAIGEGCLILEVQQNSNTTYRLYDMGRVGPDGKPRQLHIEEAMKVIRPDVDEATVASPRLLSRDGASALWQLVSCPYFQIARLDLRAPGVLEAYPRSFSAYFVADGRVRVASLGSEERFVRGSTFLLPAAAGSAANRPDGGPAVLVRIRTR